ncbi:AtpZ/AtpI family protein, partial [Faecalibaculum rodentium]
MKPAKFPGFLLANILVALLVGYLLDSWLHTSPVFIVAGVLYAVIGS